MPGCTSTTETVRSRETAYAVVAHLRISAVVLFQVSVSTSVSTSVWQSRSVPFLNQETLIRVQTTNSDMNQTTTYGNCSPI